MFVKLKITKKKLMKASLISKFNIYLCKGIIILISCFLQFFPSKKVSLTGKNPNLQRLVC